MSIRTATINDINNAQLITLTDYSNKIKIYIDMHIDIGMYGMCLSQRELCQQRWLTLLALAVL